MERDSKRFRRAACYVRVSTDGQVENYSIEEQTERLKAYCTAKGWDIYNIYTDGGYSGGNLERPALNQMLGDVHNGIIDIVLVYKLDRLSRSQKNTLYLIEDEFLKNDVEFVSVSESFETATPYGRAMIGLLSVFAQLEKEQITERFLMGRVARNKAGRYHGGSTAPTGYNYIDGELVIDEYKAMQVREVYDRFLSGYSINSIQRYMHEKYGSWTSHTLILNILKNSVYIGKVKFFKEECDGLHQPIISIDIFNKTQTLMKSRDRELLKTGAAKTPFRAKFLLSSLVFCNKCNARYSGNHGYYKCYSRSKSDKKYILDPNCKNKNWAISELDEIIVTQIKKIRFDYSYIDDILKVEQNESSCDVKTIKNRVKEIDLQISKLIELYQIKNLPIEEITSRVDDLIREKEVLTTRIESFPADIKQLKINFISQLNSFNDIFGNGILEEKRMFISSIVKSIEINDEEIIINWRI